MSSVKRFNQFEEFLGLLVFIALCFCVSALSSVVSAKSVAGWYTTLNKPTFNPPDWIFAPVWIALYLMMAVAAWRVWRRFGLQKAAAELSLFGAQLVLNLTWSILFFGVHAINAALVDIVLLLATITATAIVFGHKDRIAGLLFLPYIAWVSFATILNASIVWLN